ncbi:unnamed protein product [Penicillium nalgiovense]|nr:unnamed protein product [Penicillium nalgiovense]
MSLRRLLVSQMSLRGALLTQGLGCGELGNAAVSCGSHLSSQRPPADRHDVNRKELGHIATGRTREVYLAACLAALV